MTVETQPVRKITISLPGELVDYADHQAAQSRTSRSQIIGQALQQARARQQERLAAQGYRFYAGEAAEFAATAHGAVAEAWADLPPEDAGVSDDR